MAKRNDGKEKTVFGIGVVDVLDERGIDQSELANKIVRLRTESGQSIRISSAKVEVSRALVREDYDVESCRWIATALGCSLEELVRRGEKKARPSIPSVYAVIPETKKMRIGANSVENIYVLIGNGTDEIGVESTYTHFEILRPTELADLKDEIISAHKLSLSNPEKFFDGPCARLDRIDLKKSGLQESGEEKNVVTFHFSRIGWFDYHYLNENLDRLVFNGRAQTTIRERYANASKLYSSALGDFRWCMLSNILDVNLIPITSDGYGLVSERSISVSADKERFTSGVSENINRFADEADPDSLTRPRNPPRKPHEPKVDNTYAPTGVLSIMLTGRRGLREEVSPLVEEKVDNSRIKFLRVVWNMEKFHPSLCGVVVLENNAEELMKQVQNRMGRDHDETHRPHLIKLSSEDNDTLSFLSKWQEWDPGGLAAAISAVEYWESQNERQFSVPR